MARGPGSLAEADRTQSAGAPQGTALRAGGRGWLLGSGRIVVAWVQVGGARRDGLQRGTRRLWGMVAVFLS